MMKMKRITAAAATALVLTMGAGIGAAQAATPSVTVPAATSIKIGAYTVNGLTYFKWNANRAALGNPVGNKICAGLGCSQQFQKGYILWTQKTGTQIVTSGSIASRYSAAGWTKGALGYPTNGPINLATRSGKYQTFENGSIYWSPKTGAHVVNGGIKTYFASKSNERGFLGYPKTDAVAVPNGLRQDFEGGVVYSATATGKAFSVNRGDISTYYDRKGGAKGVIGLPTSDKTTWNGGYYQRFQNGVITWGPSIGSRFITNEAFAALASNFAKYGWPTADSVTNSVGIKTQFQKNYFVSALPGNVYPFTAVKATSSSVIIYGDSQLDGDAWMEQGARVLGYTDQYSLGYGGMGYSTRNAIAAGTGWDALNEGHIPFPGGNPGLVIINLGGNDAKSGRTDAQVISDSTATWKKIKTMYPNSKIIVNGVMSRTDDSHIKRRHIDDVLAANAKKQGVTYISVSGLASVANAEYKDNVHMTQNGHNAVAKLYTPLLQAALNN